MSSESGHTPNSESGNSWKEDLISEQTNHPPKTRTRPYYYSDGLADQTQMWLKHTPGVDIPLRITKVWDPGYIRGHDYDSSLQMNIGTELDAYKLYLALQAYFEDDRSVPWFLSDSL